MDPDLPLRGIKGEDKASDKLERRETAQKPWNVVRVPLADCGWPSKRARQTEI
jgi:hypothetical protein